MSHPRQGAGKKQRYQEAVINWIAWITTTHNIRLDAPLTNIVSGHRAKSRSLRQNLAEYKMTGMYGLMRLRCVVHKKSIRHKWRESHSAWHRFALSTKLRRGFYLD
jgi:hypothetical protein